MTYPNDLNKIIIRINEMQILLDTLKNEFIYLLNKTEQIMETNEENCLLTLGDLGLSIRSMHALEDIKIKTIPQLLNKYKSDLLCIPNFGRKSLNEIIDALAYHNLKLKGC